MDKNKRLGVFRKILEIVFIVVLIIFTVIVLEELFQYIQSYFKGNIKSQISDLPQLKDMVTYIITIAFSFLLYKSSEKSRMLSQEIDRREINKDNEKIRENALIIYYDFKLAFVDIYALYMNKKIVKNKYFGIDLNDVPKKVYLSEQWISNVAVLNNQLRKYNCDNSDFTIKDIVEEMFLLYGDLLTVKKALDADKEDYSTIEKIANNVFNDDLLNKIEYICKTGERVSVEFNLSTNRSPDIINVIEKKHYDESAAIIKEINSKFKKDSNSIINKKWNYILTCLEELTRYGISKKKE